MFTGLVQERGILAAVETTGEGVRLRVRAGLASQLAEGDSVAVNGVCLTARSPQDGAFSADVMAETLRRSSLASAAAGAEVNLELAMRADGRLGGHIVQGHVDATGTVASVRKEGFARVVRVHAPPEVLRYVVEKGSVAVDGVSLTVSALGEDWLEVSLIPETLERTTLGAAEEGRVVNLEADVLAKYVERLVAR